MGKKGPLLERFALGAFGVIAAGRALQLLIAGGLNSYNLGGVTATAVVAAVFLWAAIKLPLGRNQTQKAATDDGQAPGIAAAGWYADPWSRFEYRYWDGSTWTSMVASGGRVEVDDTHP